MLEIAEGGGCTSGLWCAVKLHLQVRESCKILALEAKRLHVQGCLTNSQIVEEGQLNEIFHCLEIVTRQDNVSLCPLFDIVGNQDDEF